MQSINILSSTHLLHVHITFVTCPVTFVTCPVTFVTCPVTFVLSTSHTCLITFVMCTTPCRQQNKIKFKIADLLGHRHVFTRLGRVRKTRNQIAIA